MAFEEYSWRTQNFRQAVVAKIDQSLQKSGKPTTKNSIEMESDVFLKAETKEEYLGFVARLILEIREWNAKKNPPEIAAGTGQGGNQGMPDPIEDLQTLARLSLKHD